ncbi:MAG TPA: hypothetical protein VKR55_23020 [Bradyrhizobium sp.]|uniref:hypothetical protein n=1 Tax=Bradyrhizobium sp. TaxID=376 RepID=UPI002C8315A1|nr:hypothetical protein [Bradyrhizobium sp.]HLZ05009.1 hypothetical protein [Bradyrhizobium sp.]
MAQAAKELMRHAGFADARGAYQCDDPPGRGIDLACRSLQLEKLVGAPDKGGESFGRAGMPARQSADFHKFVAWHRRGKSFQPLWRQGIEDREPG